MVPSLPASFIASIQEGELYANNPTMHFKSLYFAIESSALLLALALSKLSVRVSSTVYFSSSEDFSENQLSETNDLEDTPSKVE